MHPSPGSGTEILVLSAGLLAPIYLFPLIIQGEAAVLRRLMPHGRATRDSFWMNSITTVMICCSLGIVPGISAKLTEKLTGVGFVFTYRQLPEHVLTFSAIYLFITCAISVLVEGGILLLLERRYLARRIWLASVAANVTSYTVLFVLLAWWFSL